MTRSQWALRHRATSRIFHGSLPFRHEYGLLACGIKYIFPLCMIFSDDIVLGSTRKKEVQKELRHGAEYQQKENCIQEVLFT